jgi:hypothetical protein
MEERSRGPVDLDALSGGGGAPARRAESAKAGKPMTQNGAVVLDTNGFVTRERTAILACLDQGATAVTFTLHFSNGAPKLAFEGKPSAKTKACITKVVQKIEFPATSGDATITITK